MSKDAKKKAERNESWKDQEIYRLNALVGALNADVVHLARELSAEKAFSEETVGRLSGELDSVQKACESAAAGAAGLLTRAEAAEAEIVVLKALVAGHQEAYKLVANFTVEDDGSVTDHLTPAPI